MAGLKATVNEGPQANKDNINIKIYTGFRKHKHKLESQSAHDNVHRHRSFKTIVQVTVIQGAAICMNATIA